MSASPRARAVVALVAIGVLYLAARAAGWAGNPSALPFEPWGALAIAAIVIWGLSRLTGRLP